jgi:hypothetical protein
MFFSKQRQARISLNREEFVCLAQLPQLLPSSPILKMCSLSFIHQVEIPDSFLLLSSRIRLRKPPV